MGLARGGTFNYIFDGFAAGANAPKLSVTYSSPRSLAVTVNANPVVSITGNPTICENGSTSLSPTTGGTWVSNNPAVATVTDAGVVSAVAPGTATFTFTSNTAPNCSAITNAVTVKPLPTVADPADQIVCNGSPVIVGFTGWVPGTVYIWTNDNTSIGLAASGTGDISSFATVNTGNAPVIATITVTPTITDGVTCTGAAQTFTITVNPSPTGSANPETICSGSTSNVVLNSNISGTTFTWTAALFSGTVSGFSNGNGSTIAQLLTNTGNTQGVVRYTVIPTSPDGCEGNNFTVDVTVNPAPTVSYIAAPMTFSNDAGTCAVSVSQSTIEANLTGVIGTLSYSIIDDNDFSLTPITLPYTFPVGLTHLVVTASRCIPCKHKYY